MANKFSCGAFCFIDSFVVSFVFGPLTVAYWHGTWALLDLYIFPNNEKLSSWISLFIGGTICSSFYLLQSFFRELSEKWNCFLWILFTRCYSYVFGIGIVNYWRGVWYLINIYTGTGVVSSIVSAIIGMGLLLILRVSRTVHAPPCVIDYDVGPTYFDCRTRFKAKICFTARYMLDVLLTSVVIHGLVVFFWRGLYQFQTNVLFPSNHEYSVLASFLIGYGVLSLMLFLQVPVSRISTSFDTKPFVFKLILEDLFHLLVNISGVCIWRGLWESCKLFIWPDDVTRSAWFTHALGQLAMMACLVGNSLIARGCELDGDYINGEGVRINNSYYAHFVHYFSSEVPELLKEEKNHNLLHDVEKAKIECEHSTNKSNC